MSNPIPSILPALREWTGGTGRYTLPDAARLVVDEAYATELLPTAQTFLQDLRRVTSLHPEISIASVPDRADIFFSLAQSDDALEDQGYVLDIADRLGVRANTATGILYGAQTILQILRQVPDRRSLPRGQARDYPRFPHRSLMLDLGRKYWEMEYIRGLMEDMLRIKLNELHLHLTDAYAFRLESEQHPKLTAEKAYSKTDIAQLQAWADEYRIILTPEIDLPAHSVVINRYDPRLAFSCPSMAYGRWPEAQDGDWTINYADPYARAWIKELLSEYIPLFTGPSFHIGTDEVPDGDAPEKCPQLVRCAQQNGYPHAGDVLVEWINEMNQFVRSFGKQMQIWSWWERSPHSIWPDRDIIVNAWVAAGDSRVFLDAGYPVLHTAEDTLCLTPTLDLFPNEVYLYNEWNLSDHPSSIGYKICVWADQAEGQPDSFFEAHLRRPRAILAERMWNGGTPSQSLGAFLDLVETLGRSS